MDEIITPSEVAALLKIHVKTVYRLARKGVLLGNRIGHSWRFSKSQILDVFDQQRRAPGSRDSTGVARRYPLKKL